MPNCLTGMCIPVKDRGHLLEGLGTLVGCPFKIMTESNNYNTKNDVKVI